MKFMLIFALVFISAKAVSFYDLVQEQWTEFKLNHAKKYENPTEERYRMKIFMENAHKVAKHNQLYEKGRVSFSMKLNKYSDMLSYEIVKTMNGYNRTTAKTNNNQDVEEPKGATYIPPANVKLADEVDWRASGAVTEVKDQGQCGSCWSFSATGSLEGQHFRQTGQLVSLSEQNLIDCSITYGNNGCDGGLMDYAFQYIRDNRGIDTENYYPYEAMDDICRYNPADSGATDTGYADIASGDEGQLQWAVATVGPISVAIDAGHESFQQYGGGVYYEPDCSSENLDHGVLVVGYGTENGQDYWLVKNSWGTSWGEQGYIKMARNSENNCGIATQASYPLV